MEVVPFFLVHSFVVVDFMSAFFVVSVGFVNSVEEPMYFNDLMVAVSDEFRIVEYGSAECMD